MVSIPNLTRFSYPPMRLLLLERAAWQLGRTQRPIPEVAFDAHYGSLEAFTRASAAR